MADNKINVDGQNFRIVQGVSELKHGFDSKTGNFDYSRMSVYGGSDHIHLGSNSPTKTTKK